MEKMKIIYVFITSHIWSIIIGSQGKIVIKRNNPNSINGGKIQNSPTSDYVFESDYDLKPLEEVETFIKEYKHLPDIPSAEEFKENGVGLGEMIICYSGRWKS